MIAGLFDQVVQACAFAPEDEDAIDGEIEVGVIGRSSFVQADDPDVGLLHLLESADEIGHACDPNVFGGSGRGLGYGRGDGCTAPFRQQDAANPSAFGSSKESSKVVRVFKTVQSEEEFWEARGGREQKILDGEEGSFAKIGYDTLMGVGFGEPGELISRLCRDADSCGTGERGEALQLCVATLASDGDAVEPTGSGANGFFDGMEAV
jgi:hypothetical protein